MPNYQNSKIYKLYDLETNEKYIGSTTQKLSVRLSGHVRSYKDVLNGKKKYVSSFKIIEKGNYRIELIENYPCENKEELRKREGYYIRNCDCVNKLIAGRMKKEINISYYQNNKEFFKNYYQNYYQRNKAKYAEKLLCNCGGYYRRDSKYDHKKTKRHKKYLESLK